MALVGISIADGRFELLANGRRFGERRDLDEAAVGELQEFGKRYWTLARTRTDRVGLLTLGRELFRWLDGDAGALGALRDAAPRPLVFEVRGPRRPSDAEWALLRAPFELLAEEPGFLAQNARLQFCPVRRLGEPGEAPPLGDHRLGLAFMAAAPRGQHELDYEAEETAILQAVSPERIDLVVEESGDPEELGARLATLTEMQALHLSCHGLNAWRPKPGDPPRPVLMMEDAEGNARPTEAADLIDTLAAAKPRLVFLSACLTAAAAGQGGGTGFKGDREAEGAPALREGLAHSLASALIDAGQPAVLGWDGSVADRAAIAFAGELYEQLARQIDLPRAVAAARRALLSSQEDVVRDDWHLARLWLGPDGGGPIVGGTRKRSLLPASHGHKVFLDARGEVPVAAPEMFVGRRRQIQTALRVLESQDCSGVLIHGMGRLGKSSLASRIADRVKDRMAIAVVFGHYDALSIVEVLEGALKTVPAARDLLRARKDEVRRDKDRLEDLLIDLLSGPCAQASGGNKPVLLIIDDLERILVADEAGGRHRVEPTYAPVLAMVLRAFDPALSDSRLLLTSRFPFALDRLEDRLHRIQLPPMSEAAQKKLELRQTEVAKDAKLAEAELQARLKLMPRVRKVAQGNPGLQDLIGQKLVLSKEVPLERAEATLGEMEAWLAGGELPEEPEVRAFLENLTLDTLMDLAGEAGRDLLQALTLFQVPVPEGSVAPIAREVGGSLHRLQDLGLLDGFEDLVDPRTPALAVNGLAATRVSQLTDESAAELAKLAIGRLFESWGGPAGAGRRPYAADLELTRLALLSDDPEPVAACGSDAMAALEGAPAAVLANFGQQAIALLERHGRDVPWLLLSRTASAVATAGEGAAADVLFAKGVQALEARRQGGEPIDPFDAGFLLFEHGKRLMARGDPDGAERVFREAEVLAREGGREISAAIARGWIAYVLERRGEVGEALRIREQEQLPVYERLGDVCAVAITKGRIADILASRGELDEALRIREQEQLPVYERLGEVRSVAITKGQIADILVMRGELDEALRIRREEQLPVMERLGEVREVAITKGKIADILERRGELDEALRIRREEQLPVYERLGEVRSVAITKGKIADILVSRGELDEALWIQVEERLPLEQQLGEPDGIAHIKFNIAQIRLKKGIRTQEELQAVIHELRESFSINLKLQRADGVAVVGKAFGEILAQLDQKETARQVLEASHAAYLKLGQHDQAAQVAALLVQLKEE